MYMKMVKDHVQRRALILGVFNAVFSISNYCLSVNELCSSNERSFNEVLQRTHPFHNRVSALFLNSCVEPF